MSLYLAARKNTVFSYNREFSFSNQIVSIHLKFNVKQNQKVQESNSKVQRIACLMITGCFPTIPVVAIAVMLDRPPIYIQGHVLLKVKAWITNFKRTTYTNH